MGIKRRNAMIKKVSYLLLKPILTLTFHSFQKEPKPAASRPGRRRPPVHIPGREPHTRVGRAGAECGRAGRQRLATERRQVPTGVRLRCRG